MRRMMTAPLAALVLSLVLVGCESSDADGEAMGDDAAMEDGAMAGEADGAMADGAMADRGSPPDTTAAAVWAHLQGVDYRSWDLWPGKAELYVGQEPHGMLLTTYTNAIAARALAEGNLANMPSGAILVKENWMADSTFAAATVMMKVPGYNPDHQDWLFAKYQPDGTVDAFGRAAGCQACHQQADGSDYIYTTVAR